MTHLVAGQRIGERFEVVSLLGTGGMAEVFLARDLEAPQDASTVVLKRIHPHLTERRDFVRMFGDEARITLELQHPNITRVRDVVVHDGIPLLVMEHIVGVSFLDWVVATQDRPVRLGVLAEALRQVCEGLEYAHALSDPSGAPLNIVHRDISPQNILVGVDGRVKIIDFGVANAAIRSDRTQAGVLKGKFPYLSPERVRGERGDRRADIFSLGVVAFEMSTRKRLFWRASPYGTLVAVAKAPVPPLHQVDPQIPVGWDNVVRKALERDPGRRYQSAAEMGAAITGFAASVGLGLDRSELAALVQGIYEPTPFDSRPKAYRDTAVAKAETLPSISIDLSAEDWGGEEAAETGEGALQELVDVMDRGGADTAVGPAPVEADELGELEGTTTQQQRPGHHTAAMWPVPHDGEEGGAARAADDAPTLLGNPPLAARSADDAPTLLGNPPPARGRSIEEPRLPPEEPRLPPEEPRLPPEEPRLPPEEPRLPREEPRLPRAEPSPSTAREAPRAAAPSGTEERRRAGEARPKKAVGHPGYSLPALPAVPPLVDGGDSLSSSFAYTLDVIRASFARRRIIGILEAEMSTLERERDDTLRRVGERVRGVAERIDPKLATRLDTVQREELSPSGSFTDDASAGHRELEYIEGQLERLQLDIERARDDDERHAASAMLHFAEERAEQLRGHLEARPPPSQKPVAAGATKLLSDLGRLAWKGGHARELAGDLYRRLDRCQVGLDTCRSELRDQREELTGFERRPVAVAVLTVLIPLAAGALLLAMLAMSGRLG